MPRFVVEVSYVRFGKPHTKSLSIMASDTQSAKEKAVDLVGDWNGVTGDPEAEECRLDDAN